MDKTVFLAVSCILGLLVAGTLFYHFYENWSWIDSFYFTSVTITTVGYGDLHPTRDLTKIFTALLAFSGVSIGLFSLTRLTGYYFHGKGHKDKQGRRFNPRKIR
jgi:hypothetical protein